MGFRLVPKSVTLNDLPRNDCVVCVISLNSVALGPHDVKVFEDTPIHSLELNVSRRSDICRGSPPARALS